MAATMEDKIQNDQEKSWGKNPWKAERKQQKWSNNYDSNINTGQNDTRQKLEYVSYI